MEPKQHKKTRANRQSPQLFSLTNPELAKRGEKSCTPEEVVSQERVPQKGVGRPMILI